MTVSLTKDGKVVTDEHFTVLHNLASPEADKVVFPVSTYEERYRSRAEWKFRAVGEGCGAGLSGIARGYGVTT